MQSKNTVETQDVGDKFREKPPDVEKNVKGRDVFG